MTSPDEAIARLDGMTQDGDPESLHGIADDLLCDVLRWCGNSAVAEAYERAAERVGFWYS